MLDSWIASCAGLDLPLSRERIKAWQLERLNQVLSYARNHSSFYCERFPGGPVASLAEFSGLPFTTPDDLRLHGNRMVCTDASSIDRIVTLMETSGSEGKPKRVFFTADDQERTIDYFHHGMLEFAKPGDRALILFPGHSPGSLNVLLSEALSRMDVTAEIFGFPSPEDYDTVIGRILTGRINYLVGPAPVIAAIAARSEKKGTADQLSEIIDAVLLAGSFVSDENCRIISSLWHCRIDEDYGMTETGLGGAVGCKVSGGYHTWESDLYYEIVDPLSGSPLPEGQYGELVVTTLCRKAMPFIRYRTGDISRIIPGPCA